MMAVDWRCAELPAGVTHRLVLMRHGRPVEHARGRCYGELDVELSDAGRAQVRIVAACMARIGIAAVYSSPRVRALDSARLLADAAGTSVTIDARLSEMSFGELEGREYADVEREYPELFAQWMQTPTDIEFPGGESYRTLRDRVSLATQQIRDRHPAQIIAVVAHAGPIRAVLARDLGMEARHIFRLDQTYGAISCVDYYGDAPVIRTVNWLPRAHR